MAQLPWFSEIVDLGRELYNGMPNLGANLTAFFFDEHRLTVDQMPLERLILPGHLLRFLEKGPREPITPTDFEAAVQRSGRPITTGTAVIAWTGQDKHWGKEGFTTERPYIPAESARWLVDRQVTLFGTDLIGLDNPDERWEPTHVAFLKGGLPMVQQLCNLERLEGKEFLFIVLPLKMRGGTGSPVRPVALVQASGAPLRARRDVAQRGRTASGRSRRL